MEAVLVTGVSTGIGRAVAQVLAKAGYRIYGSVRRDEDARRFEAELGPGARALRFDVRDDGAVAEAAALVAAEEDSLAGLVNNAGVAVASALELVPLDEFRDQIAVNLTGVLAVTRSFLPLLRAGPRPGRIINISSVAGRTAMPFLGAYSAAKFGLEALSDSLRRELIVHGIDVVVIQPGGIATPIWTKAGRDDGGAHDGSAYRDASGVFRALALRAGEGGLPADRVGECVLRVLQSRRPRPRYLLSPSPFSERVMRVLPTRLLDRLIAARLGLRRPPR